MMLVCCCTKTHQDEGVRRDCSAVQLPWSDHRSEMRFHFNQASVANLVSNRLGSLLFMIKLKLAPDK